MTPRFKHFQAVMGTDNIRGADLVMLFGLDTMGDIWVKKNALVKDAEWQRVDARSLPEEKS